MSTNKLDQIIGGAANDTFENENPAPVLSAVVSPKSGFLSKLDLNAVVDEKTPQYSIKERVEFKPPPQTEAKSRKKHPLWGFERHLDRLSGVIELREDYAKKRKHDVFEEFKDSTPHKTNHY